MKSNTIKKITTPKINYEKFKIVLIGVSEYPEDKLIENVPNINSNIEGLRNLFSDFSFPGLLKSNILVLKNENKVSIEKQLSIYAKETEADDILVVYYAGHGLISPDDLSVYLSTSESVLNDIDSTSISIQRFRDLISKSPAKQKVIILDACYSGAIHRTISEYNLNYSNIYDKYEGEFIVSSSSENEQSSYSKENTNEPTFFTKELIDVLSLGSSVEKQLLTLNDVFNNVNHALHEKKLSVSQKTVINSIGDRAFVYNRKYNDLNIDLEKVNYSKNIIKTINHSKAQMPDKRRTFSNLILNIFLSFVVGIAFSLVFITNDFNEKKSILARNIDFRIENIRKIKQTTIINVNKDEDFSSIHIYDKVNTEINSNLKSSFYLFELDTNNIK